MCLDADRRVERVKRIPGRLDLKPVHIAGAEQHLPLEIIKAHRVGIDDCQAADPGCHKIERCRSTEAAGSDHHHPGSPQPGLTGPADFLQEDMSGMTVNIGLAHLLRILSGGVHQRHSTLGSKRSKGGVSWHRGFHGRALQW